MTVFLSILFALLLDLLLGEPKKWHPLVGFGRWAHALEKKFNHYHTPTHTLHQKYAGFLALILALLPGLILCFFLQSKLTFSPLISSVILYFCIAPKSLLQHTLAVYQPLKNNQLPEARTAIGMIVSRETAQMNPHAIRNATLETTLENGADAIFAPIFWFIIAGVPGALLYRLSNTLDAMWGYKNNRYINFGYSAARLDDLLNYIPARLTAISYALLGHTQQAWQCYREQSPLCESPNAGVVMSAGAGSLGLQLGGDAIYHGILKHKPLLGCGRLAMNSDIKRANSLIILTIVLWLFIIFLGGTLA